MNGICTLPNNIRERLFHYRSDAIYCVASGLYNFPEIVEHIARDEELPQLSAIWMRFVERKKMTPEQALSLTREQREIFSINEFDILISNEKLPIAMACSLNQNQLGILLHKSFFQLINSGQMDVDKALSYADLYPFIANRADVTAKECDQLLASISMLTDQTSFDSVLQSVRLPKTFVQTESTSVGPSPADHRWSTLDPATQNNFKSAVRAAIDATSDETKKRHLRQMQDPSNTAGNFVHWLNAFATLAAKERGGNHAELGNTSSMKAFYRTLSPENRNLVEHAFPNHAINYKSGFLGGIGESITFTPVLVPTVASTPTARK